MVPWKDGSLNGQFHSLMASQLD